MKVNAVELDWKIINDDVMGGVSSSEYSINKNNVEFTGFTSLDNSGGFASIRGILNKNLTSHLRQIKISHEKDDRDYEIILKSKKNNYSYRHLLKTEFINLSDFEASYRGSKIVNYQSIIASDIESIGIILADGKQSDFKIILNVIEFK